VKCSSNHVHLTLIARFPSSQIIMDIKQKVMDVTSQQTMCSLPLLYLTFVRRRKSYWTEKCIHLLIPLQICLIVTLIVCIFPRSNRYIHNTTHPIWIHKRILWSHMVVSHSVRNSIMEHDHRLNCIEHCWDIRSNSTNILEYTLGFLSQLPITDFRCLRNNLGRVHVLEARTKSVT